MLYENTDDSIALLSLTMVFFGLSGPAQLLQNDCPPFYGLVRTYSDT
jgi:hypothetical protein